MGDLVFLSARRGDEAAAACSLGGADARDGADGRDRAESRDRAEGDIRVYLSLDCPRSYLTAERIERALGEVTWVPVLGPLSEGDGASALGARRARAATAIRLAEREAGIRGIPLTRPRTFPQDSRRAARAAMLAGRHGACQRFSLAILRLAFCGGFDISGEPAIRQAAEVAGLDPDELAGAASDPAYDRELDATSAVLPAQGVLSPPAIAIGGSWFDGPDAVVEAMSLRSSRLRLDA